MQYVDTFYKLTPEAVLKLCNLQLGGNDLKLWMYLSSLDPFGDRKVVLPTSADIARRLNMSIASFFRAKARLQKLGLFSFFDKYTEFINLLGSHSSVHHSHQPYPDGYKDTNSQICNTDSQICEVVSQICDTTTHICDTDSHICENQPLKPPQDKAFTPSQTIQTIQTLSYSSDSETPLKERESIDVLLKEESSEGENINTESQEPSLHTQLISQDHRTNVLVQTQVTQEDTFSPVRGVDENNGSHKGLVGMSDVILQSSNTPPNPSRVQLKAWEWLPDGEWKVDGKLDPDFHNWLAKKWMDMYNKTDFFMAKADVLAYFQKAPERLPIRYLQWLEENNARHLRKIQLSNNDDEQSSPTPPNRQSLPSDNSVICSDGQRTVKSKDYTGISKQPQIPVNPNLSQRFSEWLNQKTGRTQPQYNNNQTQGLSPI